ncbi:hypothetical protein HDU92_006254 [Lobulomyces angularis]|nr:hypothetical protein HDU92_006254 [Lobulomyces angularis]
MKSRKPAQQTSATYIANGELVEKKPFSLRYLPELILGIVNFGFLFITSLFGGIVADKPVQGSGPGSKGRRGGPGGGGGGSGNIESLRGASACLPGGCCGG